MSEKIAEYFDGKKVLVLGFGREGKATFDFLRKNYPDMTLTVADKRELAPPDEKTRVICGEKYLESINEFDVVMQSPGISLRDVKVDPSTEITGEMDLFLRFADCFKIGITGTKGKTTTTTLIYNMVKQSGRKCCLLGNIGVPVFECLDTIDKDFVAVIEMSCHQLEFSKASPNISVLTNIYPEHLDHYNGFEGYVNAKLNIVRYQTQNDHFIYNADQGLDGFADIEKIKSNLLPVSVNDDKTDAFLSSLDSINRHLRGENAKQDIFFAVRAAKILGVEEKDIVSSLENFGGIEHRLEEVGTWKEITFFNDSIATIPHAVVCNVKALGNVSSLIFGGLDRGIDYGELVDFLSSGEVENLIGLPETGHTIIASLLEKGYNGKTFAVETMDEAVKTAYEQTQKGKACLFSPAASSYNRYKNFEEKGNHFKSLCKQLGEKN
ncbi:MAG: UDP-N-acetylmuramoyl-L-alanine--D-glutamate ligase [Clostridia bacterium]|nr:UDP-N-acetylmuramoyl-L-alanine--D-glutamate ligase [Clostridia bacterium]